MKKKSKYQPDDKVRVRKDLCKGKSYLCENGAVTEHPQAWYCNDVMAARAGSIMTITDVDTKKGYVYYHVLEDSGMWCWTADMFAGLADDSTPERWEPPEDETLPPWKESWEELF